MKQQFVGRIRMNNDRTAYVIYEVSSTLLVRIGPLRYQFEGWPCQVRMPPTWSVESVPIQISVVSTRAKHINSENTFRTKGRFKQGCFHQHHEPLLRTISSFQKGHCNKRIFLGNWNRGTNTATRILARGGGGSRTIPAFSDAQSNLQNG